LFRWIDLLLSTFVLVPDCTTLFLGWVAWFWHWDYYFIHDLRDLQATQPNQGKAWYNQAQEQAAGATLEST
jgi:hypothetical protein